MARGRKANPAYGNGAGELLEALKFLAPAMKAKGTVRQTHCKFAFGMLGASNDVLTIGVKVAEKLETCPDYFKLVHALSNCGEDVSITQQDKKTLVVKSGKFRSKIPCLELADIPVRPPNPAVAVINDTIKEALKVASCIADDEGGRPILKAVNLSANIATATNGYAAVGFWHGIDLPDGLLLPPEAVKAVCLTNKALAGLGFTDTAVTFHFEDGSFIRTQRYIDKYPNIRNILRPGFEGCKINEDFYKAVRTVIPACMADYVYFRANKVCSHSNPEDGAVVELESMPTGADGQGFRFDMLLDLEKHTEMALFDPEGRRMYFSKGNATGVIMGVKA